MTIIWAIVLWIIATIVIEYIDWDRVFEWKKKVKAEPKAKKESKIRWEVVWSIRLVIAIAIIASLTK